MRKAIATFGTGGARLPLTVAMPTFMEYAERHGYEIVLGSGDSDGRPPAWGKVLLLRRLLDVYDFVLWIDADAIILDNSRDIADHLSETDWQLYAVTESPAGPAPCTGVWGLRATDDARQLLDLVWQQTDLIDHRWWEQTAVMRVMGWATDPPLGKIADSPFDAGTVLLDEEWDAIPWFPYGYAPARIRHYAAWSNGHRVIAMRTDRAEIDWRRDHKLAAGARYAYGLSRRWIGATRSRAALRSRMTRSPLRRSSLS